MQNLPTWKLNSSKGIIGSRELALATEGEMLIPLGKQGVTHIRRIMIRKGGKKIETNIYILTFNQLHVPMEVKIGYYWEGQTVCSSSTEVLQMPKMWTPQRSLYRTAHVCDGKLTKIPKRDFYFRTCEDGAGWHLIPYIISPRSDFFSQAYKNWHIMWGTNLGPDWPPLARGSKFHTIHTPTRSLNFFP